MKKILMRAGMSPLDNLHPARILLENSIGNNSGNLIYAYSLFRTLTLEDTEIVPNYYKIRPNDAEYINETYDSFVIPLADAFRGNFAGEMRRMTKLIRQLNIPCVVVGVGLRLPFQKNLDSDNLFNFKFNKDVKKFVKAVLDKSAIIGVRGEITGEYLKSLGFKEEVDYTVIGCPSMYTFGRELHVKDSNLTSSSKICFNNSIICDNNIHDFIDRSRLQIKEHYFLPQRIQEFNLLYRGIPYEDEKNQGKNYPMNLEADLYKNNRVRAFVNVPTWLDFLSEADFSFGSRLHGNIAAILAGTKSLLIPYDSRMKEITEYHNLPHIWQQEITKKSDIFEIFAKTDFNKIKQGHDRRFDHYIDFLNKNELNHIYQEGISPEVVPLDEKIKDIKLHLPIQTLSGIKFSEKIDRKIQYNYRILKKKIKN